ncbi:MAG: hypothetical protein QM763_08100 [Agriterribacter sp.]
MKSTLMSAALVMFLSSVNAQTEFEGTYAYKTEVKSQLKDISAQSIKNLLLAGDSTVGWYKNGNEKQVSGIVQGIAVPDKKKVYFIFKGIDTLYYMDFSDGMGSPENLKKELPGKRIAGFDCLSISFTLNGEKKKIFYAPILYVNPAHSAANKLNGANVLNAEMKAFRIETVTNNPLYDVTETTYSVRPGAVDDRVFDLPALPEAKLNFKNLLKPAEFPGKEEGWKRYMRNNLKGDIATRYLKIPKGESSAAQQAIVEFYISEEGRPVHISVANKNEIHPKLAEEAIRVINESPNWKPGSLFGKKVFYFFRMPIQFLVTKG